MQCEWCWKWGKWYYLTEEDKLEFPQALQLYDMDCVGPICEQCLDRKEPPWYPNASDRAANAMRLFFPDELQDWAIRKYMSWFVVWNDP